jgi:ArsR family transcriptional regulator, arsenate/arsenite/antimonite-responsive transcriptional repressor
VRRRIKSNGFDFARLFTALGDKTRLRLLNLIAGREVCVCHLVDVLGESQPKISRHLAYLRRAGLVSARREGKWMHYSLMSPRDEAGAAVLESVVGSLRVSAEMQRDLKALDGVCCIAPERDDAYAG